MQPSLARHPGEHYLGMIVSCVAQWYPPIAGCHMVGHSGWGECSQAWQDNEGALFRYDSVVGCLDLLGNGIVLWQTLP